MPPGTSLSGDRTEKESGKRSYPTVGIPQSNFLSWCCGCTARQSLAKVNGEFLDVVSILSKTDPAWLSFHHHSTQRVYYGNTDKTSSISPFTAKISWVKKFSEQLQDYYRRKNITNNIMDPTRGRKKTPNIKAYMPLQLNGKEPW